MVAFFFLRAPARPPTWPGQAVTARGTFGPDRIRDTVATRYCSVAGTAVAAQYFPVSPIPETEREPDQLKNVSL